VQILTGNNGEESKISSHKAVEITMLRSKKESRCCRGTREEFTDLISGKIKWRDAEIKWRDAEIKWRDAEIKWRDAKIKWRDAKIINENYNKRNFEEISHGKY